MTIERIRRTGIIAVIRADLDRGRACRVAVALVEAGIEAVEVSLTSKNAFEAIDAIRRTLGASAIVGAGTVRNSADATGAMDAGAQFLIAPNFSAEVLAVSSDRVPYIPGVLTPGEIARAADASCRLLKLFPAEVGGPSYLRSLSAPFPDVEFIPTGGITAQIIPEYVKQGAVAVGVGSSLVHHNEESDSGLSERARVFRRAWDDARDIDHNG